MSEPTIEEVISIISALFQIKGVDQKGDTLQIEIEKGEFKQKFSQLVKQLEPKNLIARLEADTQRMHVIISRVQAPKIRRFWIPHVLFLATIVMIMIDGYYHTVTTNSIIYIGDPFQISILFTISLIGILGIHELGHMIASKAHKLKTSWPYFIPGIPVFGFPTFGALIVSRSFMVNRDILFDVGISGPIAGLIIAVIVSIFGAYLSPLIPSSQAQALSQSGLVEMHSSIIMDSTILLVGKHVVGKELIMSPILYAAWFGFLITFLNLLPAWQLDGGHIARATYGRKFHKISTYASIGILAATGYYIMALFVLLFSSKNPDIKPLDDISPISSKRKKLFVLVMVLAFLCAPLPFPILS